MSTNATGPRTDAGKARSSQNAVKHGLCSQRAVIPGEDPAEWDAFREEIVGSMTPSGLLERDLAERVALQMWRQRRVARYEAELVGAAYAEDAADSKSDDAKATLLERARLLKEALDRVIRYESHIGRQLKEARKALRECQEQRVWRTAAAAPRSSYPPPPAPAGVATNRGVAAEPSVPPAAAAPVAAEPSSFRQTDAVERSLRRLKASLPRPGVSFADYDLVPKSPAAKT
jgi:hypothetical protein